MGALIGHSCALGVWMMDGLKQNLNKPAAKIESTKFTPEQIEHGLKVLDGLVRVWYPALRRLAKRALCSCVDQPYEDMTEFLLAYSEAFSRKPKKPGMADIGNPTTEIYFFSSSASPESGQSLRPSSRRRPQTHRENLPKDRPSFPQTGASKEGGNNSDTRLVSLSVYLRFSL
jgi:hypothetical protein